MDNHDAFARWFWDATGNEPHPFQIRFAFDETLPELVDVPTGMGKTAMAVLGWMWRRRFAEEKVRKATPRRLVYCLPMRVLVEQTYENARIWLTKLDLLGEPGKDKVSVHLLMGGEDEEDWDIYPERDQIIVGTQDMLLSRALNRGYAATRSRWPMKFGLLNTDCLWVFDEIQLMGAGLATTTQLDAFRRLLPNEDADGAKNSHGCRSVWMSATLQRDWLKTVDFKEHVAGLAQLALDQDDHHNAEVKKRWTANKPLKKAEATMDNALDLAVEVRKAHKLNTRTIVIVNTVKRACSLFEALKSVGTKQPSCSEPRVVLLHSRFRPGNRRKQVDAALAEIKPGEPGTIVVSTQVIEAGVDVSATTLFTEVAPWASLVQRFGRCNRKGENDGAKVLWIDVSKDHVAPYDEKDLEKARKQLQLIEKKPEGERDVGLAPLAELNVDLPFEHTHVIRRKDLIDLFDTTPDLAGNDIEIDRFIRDVDSSDVHVFWRDYGKTPNKTDDKEVEPAPRREELCPAPIEEFKKFVADSKRKDKVWRWNFLEKLWERVDQDKIIPGQVYLARADTGGYSAERGWNPASNERWVEPIESQRTSSITLEATDADPLSQINRWQSIAEHSDDLCRAVDEIAQRLELDRRDADGLRHAARWHDRGKAHHVFQNAVDDGQVLTRNGQEISRRERPEQWRGCRFIAKAPDRQKNASGQIVDSGFWRPYDWMPKEGRKHFRHELASALSVLDPRHNTIPDELRDLVAYLVAAHHGKVRLSIRSLPNEKRPGDEHRFARGIWDNDELPATDLGGGMTAPAVKLSLEPMELGLCEQPPFEGLPSWAERMLRLRDSLGPFHLTYLEALLRAADWRASANAAKGQAIPAGE